MRVVIADDSVLLREGLARLLAEAGIETAALVGDGEELEAAVAEHRPDVAIIDIRMPPTYTHEGAQAATRLRERDAHIGLLLLSQSLESRYAAELARLHPKGFGYLLKDRVVDVSLLVDAVNRVASGQTILDPDVISFLLGRRSRRDQVADLSDRERDTRTHCPRAVRRDRPRTRAHPQDGGDTHRQHHGQAGSAAPASIAIGGYSPCWRGSSKTEQGNC